MPDDATASQLKPIFTGVRVVSASQGAGTDDDVLIEILASRSGEQIKDIIKIYKKGRRGKTTMRPISLFFYCCLMGDTFLV